MPRRLRLIPLIAALMLALLACGSDDQSASDEPASTKSTSSSAPSDTASSSPSAKPSPEGTTIEITFDGDQVEPDGVQRKVKAGEPIVFRIVADKPGELHVHSSPEEEIAYRAGTTKRTITIDQPGLVDVESHDLGKLVVKLEVR